MSKSVTRREWLAGAAVAAASACGRNIHAAYNGFALIALADQPSVAVIDLEHFALRNSIALPSPVSSIVWNGRAVYAAMPGQGSVAVIDGATLNVRRTEKFADSLGAIQAGPGNRIAVTSPNTGEVLIVDGTAMTVVDRLRLDPGVIHLDVAQDGSIAAATESSRRLTYRPVGGTARTVDIGGTPGAVRFRRDGKMLLIARPAERLLTAISVPEMHVLADLPLAMEPRHLCFEPQGGQLFVTGPGMDGVAIVFPYGTLEVEQTVLGGSAPGEMACLLAPSYLFIANSTGSAVTVMDWPTRKVIAVAEVGMHPQSILTTPGGDLAIVLDERSEDAAILRVKAIRRNRGKNGAAMFTMLPLNAKPVHAAIVPRITV